MHSGVAQSVWVKGGQVAGVVVIVLVAQFRVLVFGGDVMVEVGLVGEEAWVGDLEEEDLGAA